MVLAFDVNDIVIGFSGVLVSLGLFALAFNKVTKSDLNDLEEAIHD
jgi:hypothetical protein